MSSFVPAVLSPCVGVCQMADDGLCDGCFRTVHEIAGWLQMSDAQRRRLMDEALPEREARRSRQRIA